MNVMAGMIRVGSYIDDIDNGRSWLVTRIPFAALSFVLLLAPIAIAADRHGVSSGEELDTQVGSTETQTVDALIAALEASQSQHAALLKEFHAMQRQMLVMKREMVFVRQSLLAINEKVGLQSNKFGLSPSAPTDNDGPDLELLSEIPWPEADATEADVVTFLNEIAEATKDQKFRRKTDPQVEMLMALPRAHLGTLLQMSESNPHLRSYARFVATDLFDERDQTLVLERLATNPYLIDVVIKQRWLEDAHSILISELANSEQKQLPVAWIEAVVSFDDPATHDLLRDHVKRSDFGLAYVQHLGNLSDFSVEAFVGDLWRNRGIYTKYRDKEYEMTLTILAAEYGQLDAFVKVAKMVTGRYPSAHQRDQRLPPSVFTTSTGPRMYPWLITRAEELMHAMIDREGESREVAEWIQKFHSRLIFNPNTKMYVVKMRR